jgi:hypothetical protein
MKGSKMPAIKNMQTIADKWAVVAGRSGDAYQQGIEAPRKDWKAGALAANSNYEAGVQAAVNRKSFKTGVEKSSTQIWRDGAINKGVSRYGAGVVLGRDKYEKGFAPYASIIAATNLPDRKPKGDPANIQRVSIMAKALHDAKLRIIGAKV